MSAFSAIDLDKLPAPSVIDRKSFDSILAELRAYLVASDPGLEPVLQLESEPLVKVLQAWAYREMLLRAEVDDAGRGNMLAFATGAQLDHLAALYGIQRLVVQEGVSSANPPVLEVLETDERLRKRVQLALEGFTTAGPRGSYVFWGFTASPEVKDVSVVSPAPGEVLVTVLSTAGDGTASAELLDQVSATLNDDDIRPLTDLVTVQGAAVVPFDLVAELTLYSGPDEEVVRSAAEAAVEQLLTDLHLLDHDVTRSALFAALHREGVQNVNIVSPAADVVVGSAEAAFCQSVSVTVEGRDV